MQAGLLGKFAIEHDNFAFATLKANLLSKTAPFLISWPQWLPKEPISIASLLSEALKRILRRSPVVLMFWSEDRLVRAFPWLAADSMMMPNQLFGQYLRLVEVSKAKDCVNWMCARLYYGLCGGENVTNYAGALKTALSDDYKVYERLLDLSQFGVPQARSALVIAVRSSSSDRRPFRPA